jgi:transcriptional regulator with XRE-family HTH domain
MFNQIAFGEKLKSIRKGRNLTQEQVAEKAGVSGQAVSKWEKGECLPDVYNLKMLGRLYRVSVDNLLETESDAYEKIVQTIKIGEAVFEVVERPETIFAGKFLFAKDYPDLKTFHAAMGEAENHIPYDLIAEPIIPVTDINISINFFLFNEWQKHGFGFARETLTKTQPDGIDIFEMPASLYIRAYTNKHTAMLISKEQCEIWELFSYIREYFMPAHGFRMADNGAQEMEVYDTAEHKVGYVYMPVKKA